MLGAVLLAGWATGTSDSRLPALRVTSRAGISCILVGVVRDGVEVPRRSDAAALFKDARSYEAAAVRVRRSGRPMRETERFVVFDRYGAKHIVRVLRQFAERNSPEGVRVLPTSKVVLQLVNGDLVAAEGGSAVRIVRTGEVLRRPSLVQV